MSNETQRNKGHQPILNAKWRRLLKAHDDEVAQH